MPFVRERVEHAADWSITVERDIQPEETRTRLIANRTLAIHVCTHVQDDEPRTLAVLYAGRRARVPPMWRSSAAADTQATGQRKWALRFLFNAVVSTRGASAADLHPSVSRQDHAAGGLIDRAIRGGDPIAGEGVRAGEDGGGGKGRQDNLTHGHSPLSG